MGCIQILQMQYVSFYRIYLSVCILPVSLWLGIIHYGHTVVSWPQSTCMNKLSSTLWCFLCFNSLNRIRQSSPQKTDDQAEINSSHPVTTKAYYNRGLLRKLLFTFNHVSVCLCLCRAGTCLKAAMVIYVNRPLDSTSLLCSSYRVVKEEISDDNAKLPCFNGRVVSWVSNVDGPLVALACY